jgi:hypothetical protein
MQVAVAEALVVDQEQLLQQVELVAVVMVEFMIIQLILLLVV